MRVLHVGKYFPPFSGGIENFSADLLAALESGGIRTGALVHRHEPQKPFEKQQAPVIETTASGTRISRVSTIGTAMFTPISPGFPFALDAMISSFKPDILHLHMPNPWCFCSLLLPAARRIPTVIHWHSDVIFPAGERFLNAAYRAYAVPEYLLLKNADRIIATSPPYRDSSRALLPFRRKTTVIPLGMDPKRNTPPQQDDLNWAEQLWEGVPFRLLCIGRLTHYKGHSYLIDAMKSVPDTRLVIVGTGDQEQQLNRQIMRLSLGRSIHMTGYLPDNRLQALLSTCQVLCLPSIERTEAFGLVLLEAMHLGKPVIATEVPGSGMGWVIRDQQDGLTVPPADTRALAAACNHLRLSPDRVQAMSQSAAHRFNSCFHITPVARLIRRLYGDVLSTPVSRH